MSEDLTKVFAKLDKFHGKSEVVELQNDEGETVKFKLYQLPLKYMPLLTKLQAFQSRITTKQPVKDFDSKNRNKMVEKVVENTDFSKLSATELEEYHRLTKDILVTTMAFSICIDEGLLNYSDIAKGIPSTMIEQVKTSVELMSMSYLDKFMTAIFELSNVPRGDVPKKLKAQKSEPSEKQ